jgi:hypothetical protein
MRSRDEAVEQYQSRRVVLLQVRPGILALFGYENVQTSSL